MRESLDGDEKISSCKSNYFSAATQVFFCLPDLLLRMQNTKA
jgi:hypothetical protein